MSEVVTIPVEHLSEHALCNLVASIERVKYDPYYLSVSNFGSSRRSFYRGSHQYCYDWNAVGPLFEKYNPLLGTDGGLKTVTLTANGVKVTRQGSSYPVAFCRALVTCFYSNEVSVLRSVQETPGKEEYL